VRGRVLVIAHVCAQETADKAVPDRPFRQRSQSPPHAIDRRVFDESAQAVVVPPAQSPGASAAVPEDDGQVFRGSTAASAYIVRKHAEADGFPPTSRVWPMWCSGASLRYI